MLPDERYLPGAPSKALVRKVKSWLWHYGVRPRDSRLWLMAWAWANDIRHSYLVGRPRWPSPTEIATQYLVLLLAEMRTLMKLPFRARERMPAAVAQQLGAPQPLALPFKEPT